MTKLSPGQIFLADSREVTETEALQQHRVLAKSEQPFGRLRICDDIYIAAQKQINVDAPADGYFVLIPVTGAVDIICGSEMTVTADVGEVHVRYVKQGSSCTLSNQYEHDWINYLHLHIASDEPNAIQKSYAFDLIQQPNKLITISEDNLPFKLNIGQFSGRREAVYKFARPQNTLFAYVIAGAFEMQGRLLHQRDGLALWDLPEADLEALSNNAVILVVGV